MGIRIDGDTCEQSGACIQVCPEDVFEEDLGRVRVLNPQKCTECWLCVDNCSSGAVELD